jgi:hypothetical protein
MVNDKCLQCDNFENLNPGWKCKAGKEPENCNILMENTGILRLGMWPGDMWIIPENGKQIDLCEEIGKITSGTKVKITIEKI